MAEPMTTPPPPSARGTRPASVAQMMERVALGERFLPNAKPGDLSVLFQVGLVCWVCGEIHKRLTELRPVRVGVWWCPVCQRIVEHALVDTYAWGQDDPLPARPSGTRQPRREFG